MADRWIVASSFTRGTLTENGIPHDRIGVVPYGVDLDRFTPGSAPRASGHSGPLRLLFAGTINQRKGVAYLAQALRFFGKQDIELRMCGRVVDDLHLFEPFGSQVRITPLVSGEELIEAYREADFSCCRPSLKVSAMCCWSRLPAARLYSAPQARRRPI